MDIIRLLVYIKCLCICKIRKRG